MSPHFLPDARADLKETVIEHWSFQGSSSVGPARRATAEGLA